MPIIPRPPCIECKHLEFDVVEFTKLRLVGDYLTQIDSECKKNIMQTNRHELEFLLEPINSETAIGTFASHIESCPHFTPTEPL